MPTSSSRGEGHGQAPIVARSLAGRTLVPYASADSHRPPAVPAPDTGDPTGSAEPVPFDAGYRSGFDAGFDHGYDQGYDAARQTGLRLAWDLYRDTPLDLPELVGRRVVAVVPARNEEQTLGVLLRQLKRLPLQHIVVVDNGSTDGTAAVAGDTGCEVVTYPFALGHDVGRAMGVRGRNADIWLFTDADIVWEAEDLVPFLRAAAAGVDVALNDLDPVVPLDHRSHVVNVAKAFLNLSLGRPDLGLSSLTAVPHALTRRAVETITIPALAVPPVAQVRAVLGGLDIRAVHTVDAISLNRIHAAESPDRAPKTLAKLILGDHIEALSLLCRLRGERAGAEDAVRRRDVLTGVRDAHVGGRQA